MIVIDPRVGSKHLLDPLRARTNGQACLSTKQLKGGDVVFEGNGPDGDIMIGMELKKIGDMLGSMRTDRLAGVQLPEMHKMYKVVYVVIEGQWRADERGLLEGFQWDNAVKRYRWKPFTLAAKGKTAGSYFHFAELDKFICSLENKKNVIVVYTLDRNTTVWSIVNRYQWWQKDWDEHQSADPIKSQVDVLFGKSSTVRDWASRIPGIGWKRSMSVANHFKNKPAMVNALPSDWTDIEFIDKGGDVSHMSIDRAIKIYDWMHQEEH